MDNLLSDIENTINVAGIEVLENKSSEAIIAVPKIERRVLMDLSFDNLNEFYNGHFIQNVKFLNNQICNEKKYWLLDYIIRRVLPRKDKMTIKIYDNIPINDIKKSILPNISFDKINRIYNINIDKEGNLYLMCKMRILNEDYIIEINENIKTCDVVYSKTNGTITISKLNPGTSINNFDKCNSVYFRNYNILTIYPNDMDVPKLKFTCYDNDEKLKTQALDVLCYWFNKFQNIQPIIIYLCHKDTLYYEHKNCSCGTEAMKNIDDNETGFIFKYFYDLSPLKINDIYHISVINELNFEISGNCLVPNNQKYSTVYFNIKVTGENIEQNICKEFNENNTYHFVNQTVWKSFYRYVYLDTNKKSYYNFMLHNGKENVFTNNEREIIYVTEDGEKDDYYNIPDISNVKNMNIRLCEFVKNIKCMKDKKNPFCNNNK